MAGKKKKSKDEAECFFCHVRRAKTKLVEIFDGKYSCSHHNGVAELHDELMQLRRGE